MKAVYILTIHYIYLYIDFSETKRALDGVIDQKEEAQAELFWTFFESAAKEM